jgi:transaldolase
MKKKIEIYIDTANIKKIFFYNKNKLVKGFTTNPSLMQKSNIKNYSDFISLLTKKIKKPISFEIFSDSDEEIIKQALKISSFAKNIFVKVPIINSKGKYLTKSIKEISSKGIKLNVTAVFTFQQFKAAYDAIDKKSEGIVSIFSGRIADTLRDPNKIINHCVKYKKTKNIKILWASTREVYNIKQAEDVKCDIITISPEIFDKLKIKNYNLKKYSIDTARSFMEDSKKMKLNI